MRQNTKLYSEDLPWQVPWTLIVKARDQFIWMEITFSDKRLIPNESLRYDSINEDFYEGRPLKKDFDEMKDYIKRNRSTLQDYFQLILSHWPL